MRGCGQKIAARSGLVCLVGRCAALLRANDSIAGRIVESIHVCFPRTHLALPRKRHSKIFRSEEHTSELQSLMRISYAVFCLKKKNNNHHTQSHCNTPS